MQEPDYPSGPWTGFYNYGSHARRHPMDLFLRFSNGRISGDGVDDVGRFFISGGHASGGECHWTKTYPGSHSVAYRGFREGKGIWGLWEIAGDGRGGFHIWPLGAGDRREESTESATQEIPGELVTVGCRACHFRPLAAPVRARSNPSPNRRDGYRACGGLNS